MHRLGVVKAPVKNGILALVLLACAATIYALASKGHAASQAGPSASLNVGKTQTSSSFTHATTSSSSDNAALVTGKLLIIAPEKPELARMIQKQLAIDLAACGAVTEIITPGNGNSPIQEGQRGPDLFARIEVPNLENSGLLNRETKVKINVSLGTAPWQDNHYTISGSSPALVQFHWSGTLDLTSTFSGVRTDGSAVLAREISKNISGAISNQLAEFSSKHTLLTALPDAFYQPYIPVQDFAPLNKLQAKRIFSYPWLLTHNETFWKFSLPPEGMAALNQMAEAFKAAGWTGEPYGTNAMDYSVHLVKEGKKLDIFREKSGFGSPQASEAPANYIAHYSDPFSRDEVLKVVDFLFSQKPPLQLLLPFKNTFNREQQRRFTELAQSGESRSFPVMLALAEQYVNAKDTNAALPLLLQAKALSIVETSGSEASSRVDELAKRLYPNESAKLPQVSPDVYKRLGFVEATPALDTGLIRRKFGQPLLIFATDSEGRAESAAILCSLQRSNSCQFAVSQARDGMSSRSTRSLSAKEAWNITETMTFSKSSYLLRAIHEAGSGEVAFELKSQPQTTL